MDDRYDINVAKTSLREGYNSGDVEQILSVFADGFTDMRGGQPSFYGPDAKTVLKAKLESLFLEHSVDLAPIIFDIAMSGDLAVEYGWHVLTLRNKANESVQVVRTRYVEIWNRDPRLGWRIVFFMDNLDQAPQLVEDVLLKLKSPKMFDQN